MARKTDEELKLELQAIEKKFNEKCDKNNEIYKIELLL